MRADVRDQSVARPLREQTEERGNEQTPTHTRRAEHVAPGLLGLFQLDLDGTLDLGHLGLDDERLAVALGVVLGEDVKGFVVAVFTDEVTGTFGEEPIDRLLANVIPTPGGETYMTVMTWTMAGAICSSEGIRHAQSDGMVTVPRPTAAAII